MPTTPWQPGLPARSAIARDLRLARTEAGLSQRDLALRARLSKDVISDIETGKRWPTGLTLAKLCAVLEHRLGMYKPQAERFDPPRPERS